MFFLFTTDPNSIQISEISSLWNQINPIETHNRFEVTVTIIVILIMISFNQSLNHNKMFFSFTTDPNSIQISEISSLWNQINPIETHYRIDVTVIIIAIII